MKKQTETDSSENNKKEAILNAALEVFSLNGYGSTRIQTIAKKAGLSYGLAYYYYSSKDVLFHMVAQRAMETCTHLIEHALMQQLPSYEKLNFYTLHFLEWASTNEGAQSLLLLSQVLTNEELPKVTRIFITEKTEKNIEQLAFLIEEIQNEGYESKMSPLSTASMYQATMIGYSFLHASKLDANLPDADTFLSIFYEK